MNETAIRIGVLGATGYTGRELIGLLTRHPCARIVFATSESEAGIPLRRLERRAPDLALARAEDAPLADCDAVFSCLPHGESQRWVERARAAGARAIDLSDDLRVPGPRTPAWARGAVYGLPELHRERLRGAELVANPGCYPTAALLALAPLVRRGLIGAGPVIVDAALRSQRGRALSEARAPLRRGGRRLPRLRRRQRAPPPGRDAGPGGRPRPRGTRRSWSSPRTSFRWRAGSWRRSTSRSPRSWPPATPPGLWAEDYRSEPFVEVLHDRTPALADVVGTNRVSIGVAPVAGVGSPLLVVVAAIDNLLKGAAGQAVQNLNLMFGLEETQGLPW